MEANLSSRKTYEKNADTIELTESERKILHMLTKSIDRSTNNFLLSHPIVSLMDHENYKLLENIKDGTRCSC